jgi:8-oxo-dGTP diphosphatase
MKRPKLVAKAALFNDKNELLLLRRSSTDKNRPGEWDFPGGRVEEDENYTDAVIREVKEETGLDLKHDEVDIMYSTTTFYDRVSTMRFIFIGKVQHNPEIILSSEHDLFEWLPLEEALNRFNHPVYVGGIRYLLDNNLLEV